MPVNARGEFKWTDTKQDPPAEFIVSAVSNIFCNECDDARMWCHHQHAAMVSHADSQVIWTDDWWRWPDYDLPIPIFPTQNIWTQVHIVNLQALGITTDANGNFNPPSSLIEKLEVYWTHPLSEHRPNRFPDREFIAFIGPGEGRKVIRELLYEYMLAHHDFGTECEALHHGVEAQTIWVSDFDPWDPKPSRHFQWWSVYTTGMCTWCNTHNPGDPSNWGDAVPEPESRGVWS